MYVVDELKIYLCYTFQLLHLPSTSCLNLFSNRMNYHNFQEIKPTRDCKYALKH